MTQEERDDLSLALQKAINATLREYGMQLVSVKVAFDHLVGMLAPYHTLEVWFRETDA